MPSPKIIEAATDLLLQNQLINPCEKSRVCAVSEPEFPFREAIACCDSVHLHVKVADANSEGLTKAMLKACELDYSKSGFVKYRFGGDVNLIFSSIPVAEDELLESPDTMRQRPFLDHIGIDLRREEEHVQQLFSEIPGRAKSVDWAIASQGFDGNGVHCCHVEVNAKHWVYPGPESPSPHIPLEFAFGALKVNDVSGGCDLRPMDPVRKATEGIKIPICHD